VSRTIVITGMHRSGTSLVASLFQRAGVDVGDKLHDPDASNPRGFFEDADFLRFHEDALYARGLNIFVREPLVFVPSDEEAERARELVERRQGKPLWGWKDPRTALFLHFWDGLLDDARYLFVYRHPVDVLSSLVRRRSFAAADLTSALDAWQTYNQGILDFFLANRERSVLVDVYALVDDRQASANLLNERLGVAPSPDDICALYASGELKRMTDMSTALQEVYPAAAELFSELEAAADLAGPARNQAAAVVPEADGSSETARHARLALLLEQLDEPASRRFWREYPSWARDAEISVRWHAQQATEVPSEKEASSTELVAAQEQLEAMRKRTRDFIDQLGSLRHEYSYLLTVDERLREELTDLRASTAEAEEARWQAEKTLGNLYETRAIRIIRGYWGFKDWLRRVLHLGGAASAEPRKQT